MAILPAEIQIKDIMTTKIVAGVPDDSVLDVAQIMLQRDFNGIPIVDKKNRLIGMVTMKELLDNKGRYLPTVVKILKELRVSHPYDVAEVNDKLKIVKNLKVKSIMNRDPVYLTHNATLDQAAEAFLLRREDPLPVVDSTKKLIGIVSKYDMLKTLTRPLQPLNARPDIRGINEPLNVVENLGQKFVIISRARLRFWYFIALVFLALGVVIAIATIVRIRIL